MGMLIQYIFCVFGHVHVFLCLKNSPNMDKLDRENHVDVEREKKYYLKNMLVHRTLIVWVIEPTHDINFHKMIHAKERNQPLQDYIPKLLNHKTPKEISDLWHFRLSAIIDSNCQKQKIGLDLSAYRVPNLATISN